MRKCKSVSGVIGRERWALRKERSWDSVAGEEREIVGRVCVWVGIVVTASGGCEGATTMKDGLGGRRGLRWPILLVQPSTLPC